MIGPILLDNRRFVDSGASQRVPQMAYILTDLDQIPATVVTHTVNIAVQTRNFGDVMKTKTRNSPMKMIDMMNNFARDEDGAVTVDWVVLTAAIVGLGIAVLTTVGGATDDYADEIGNHLSSLGIKTTY